MSLPKRGAIELSSLVYQIDVRVNPTGFGMFVQVIYLARELFRMQ